VVYSTAMRAFVAVIALLMLLPALTGCLDDHEEGPWWRVPVEQRHNLPFEKPSEDWRTNTTWRSSLLFPDLYQRGPLQQAFVPVDLPLEERDAGYPEEPLMHLSYWLPKVPEGTPVPVIMTIHPYYDFGVTGDESTPNSIPDGGVGAWLYSEFVPQGYALVQASTFGTGQSTHCQDVKGRSEQLGIDAVVTWLGEQTWSNGHVAIIGKSYAGTTAWEGAQFGNPYLKTIVPISGSIGVQQMFYRNGSAESRSLVYDVLYEGSTVDEGDPLKELRLCSDSVIGPVTPWTTQAAAEFGGDAWNGYWEERYHLPDVLANYRGSVYLVWGMQDWNVDPYHAFPTYQQLRAAGIEVRGIFGQWQHNHADQPFRSESFESGYGAEAAPYMWRLDWAQEMYEWFEYYLKDNGPKPKSIVQIQDNQGSWRVEADWPSADTQWLAWNLADNLNRTSSSSLVYGTEELGLVSRVIYETAPLPQETRIAGLPQFHVRVTPAGAGGQLFVEMQDAETGLRLGHAVMDLRYRDGGYDARAVIPGITYTMKMEFNPLDVVIPEGHALRLTISPTGEDYLYPPPQGQLPLSIEESTDSVLRLPLVERGPGDLFTPPEWYEE